MKIENKAAAPQKITKEVNVSRLNRLNTSVIAVKATPHAIDDNKMDLRQQRPLLFKASTVKDQLAKGRSVNNIYSSLILFEILNSITLSDE